MYASFSKLRPALHVLAVPMAVMVGAQFASAFPLRVIPVLLPVSSVAVGLPPTAIGYLASLATVGSMIASLYTGYFVNRWGSARVLLFSMICGLVASLFMCIPLALTFAIGSIFAGFGDGPTISAGNLVLSQGAPEEIRNTLFSLKMLGGPLGGISAGVLLPHAAALEGWWAGPLIAAVVVTVLAVSIKATMPHWPEDRRRLRDSVQETLSIVAPLRLLFAFSPARRLALVGMALGLAQGVWYAYFIAYLVDELDRTIVFAGAAFSLSLAFGVVVRFVIAAVADVLKRAEGVFMLLAMCSAVPWFVLITLTPDSSDAIIMGVSALFGMTLGAWLGLQQAEIARRTSPDSVAEVSGAAIFLMFVGLAASGAIFATSLAWSGGFRFGFVCLGMLAFAAGALGFWAAMTDQNRSHIPNVHRVDRE